MFDNCTIHGNLKKNSGILGIWKSFYCVLRQTKFVIFKSIQKELEIQISISNETEISFFN